LGLEDLAIGAASFAAPNRIFPIAIFWPSARLSGAICQPGGLPLLYQRAVSDD
jgi:hypothetical protein